jgi:hypothetical protein
MSGVLVILGDTRWLKRLHVLTGPSIVDGGYSLLYWFGVVVDTD